MKETKQAKENVGMYKDSKSVTVNGQFFKVQFRQCENHKQICQRWLEYLVESFMKKGFGMKYFDFDVGIKITDLKQAIKLYDEAGI